MATTEVPSTAETIRLLTEIRDLQQQHLDEYRQASARSLATQDLAVQRQAAMVTLYRRVLFIGGGAVFGLILAALYLLSQLIR